jgi:hypothetical protein
MRFAIMANAGSMTVENAGIVGLDVSTLDPTINMVQWRDGKGEIERYDQQRLRDISIDPTPYAPFMQQFMRIIDPLSLDQAKKLQTEFIGELFDSKCQAPFHFVIAAGDFMWDCTYPSIAAMSSVGLPALYNTLLGSSNSTISDINNRFSSVASQVNSSVGTLIGSINSVLGTIANNFTIIINQTNDRVIDFLNNTVLGTHSIGAGGPNTINNMLQTGTSDPHAAPGLSGDIAHTTHLDSAPPLGSVSGGPPITVAPISTPTGGGATIQWVPIDSPSAVNVTTVEFMTMMSGIAARRQTLQITKNTKTNAVNAMTDINDVIDYDVTAGW